MSRKLMLFLCVAVSAVGACDSGGTANSTAAERSHRSASVQNGTAEPNQRATRQHPKAVEPELGRCHMELCSWSLTKGRVVVRRNVAGMLIRLSLLGGTSRNNTDGDYHNAHIHWNAKPHTVYVFCSKRLPAVLMKSDVPPAAIKASGGYHFPPFQVDVLDFVNGIPGGLESSANLFVRTCYPNDDWTSDSFARRNGLPAFDELPEVTINSPEDIFRIADRLPSR
jgi:hypothetical protein